MSILEPRMFYLSPEAHGSGWVKSLCEHFSHLPIESVDEGEHHPGDGWLLTVNRGSFIKPCPGQKGNVCCGYWVVEWVMGCPMQCEYCALQAYMRSGDVTLYVNIHDCLDEMTKLRARIAGPIRLGTGEFGDSLALESVYPIQRAIIRHAARLSEMTVELKTKSDQIEPLRHEPDRDHVIVAFSVNPPDLIEVYEHGTASLQARLRAASQLIDWGYRVAFHFDPIIACIDWKEKYLAVLEAMKRAVPADHIAWISLGTLRYPKGLDDAVLACFPGTALFREEFYPSRDGKMRYFRPLREEMYRTLWTAILTELPGPCIYMCMETKDVWERVTGMAVNANKLKTNLDGRRRFHPARSD